MKKIVLAYSGDLATSIAIPWLAGKESAEVVTLTLDLGGAAADDIRDRALAIGAARAHVIDARDEFATDFVLPSLKADALYEGRTPLVAALARPLIAKRLIHIAEIEGAGAIAHAGRAHGRAVSRITAAARTLNPSINVIDVAQSTGFTRADAIEYARQRSIPVPATAEALRSADANLWGRTAAGGSLDDFSREVPEEMFSSTKATIDTPDTPACVELEFDRGLPIQINGVPMPLVELIQSLDTIAGAHGVGRLEAMEQVDDAAKSRRIYEAPAALALHVAHRELQRLVTSEDLARLTAALALEYADLAYEGRWYSGKRAAIDALIAHVQQTVTGVVRLKFYKSRCDVISRASPHAPGPAGSPARHTSLQPASSSAR
jgi:argininosuccinate synthase